VATTATEEAGDAIRSHLEGAHGCRVAGITHRLSDRERLTQELDAIKNQAGDVLLCEIKAAGIDTASRWALDNGLDVVFMDNVPVGIDGDDPGDLVTAVTDTAVKRWSESND
jgi:cyclic 2,3-diphosphoglycerate synthetase